MGRSLIKISPSYKRAFAGFLPLPTPTAAIEVAAATTVIPGVVSLFGIWKPGATLTVGITTNIPATTSTVVVSGSAQTSLEFAKQVATALTLETNVTATALGDSVEVLASGLAVTLTIDSAVVS